MSEKPPAMCCMPCLEKQGEIAKLRIQLGNEKDCVAQRDRAIRDFVTVQTMMLEPGTLVPGDWKNAFDALRMLSKYGEPAQKVEGRSLWRTGTKLGRTLYKGNEVVGLLDTPQLASLAARAINAYATWADDEELMCTTDSYQEMQEALRQIADLEEANGHHDSVIYRLAVEALPHRPSDENIATAILQEPISENDMETHRTHCCSKHGCKYSNAGSNCPVAMGTLPQEGPCEFCDDEPVEHLAPPIWRVYMTRLGNQWAAVLQVGVQYFTIAQDEDHDHVLFQKEMLEKAMSKVHHKAFEEGAKSKEE